MKTETDVLYQANRMLQWIAAGFIVAAAVCPGCDAEPSPCEPTLACLADADPYPPADELAPDERWGCLADATWGQPDDAAVDHAAVRRNVAQECRDRTRSQADCDYHFAVFLLKLLACEG